MGRSGSVAYKIFTALGRSSWCRVWLEIYSKESRIQYQFSKYPGSAYVFLIIVKNCKIFLYSYTIYFQQVQHIATATLVWLWSRHDLQRRLVPIVIGMLILTVYRPLVLDFLTSFLLAGPWWTLIIKAITTLFISATTLHIYAGLAYSIGIFWATYLYTIFIPFVQLHWRMTSIPFSNDV